MKKTPSRNFPLNRTAVHLLFLKEKFSLLLVLLISLSLPASSSAQCVRTCPPLFFQDDSTAVPGIQVNTLTGNCSALASWQQPYTADCNATVSAVHESGATVPVVNVQGSGPATLNGFTGVFAPANWSFSGTGATLLQHTTTTLEINHTGFPGEALIEVTIPAGYNGLLSFDWSATPFDDCSFIVSDDDDVRVRRNGVEVVEFGGGGPASGSFSLPVQEGDVIGLEVESGCPILSGGPTTTATFTNFEFDGTVSAGFGIFPQGTTTVTYTTTDGGVNPACTFTVSVYDNEAPVARCVDGDGNGLVVQLSDQGGYVSGEPLGYTERPATDFDNSSTDNCGIVLVEAMLDENQNDLPDDGNWMTDLNFDCSLIDDDGNEFERYTVFVRVTDAAGNRDTCLDGEVQVRDDAQTTFLELPADQHVTTDPEECTAESVTLPVPKVIDGCLGEQPMSLWARSDQAVLDPSAPFELGVTTVTWAYLDPYDPADVDTLFYAYNVIVIDDNDPVFTGLPADEDGNAANGITLLRDNDPGLCGAAVEFDLMAFDTCDADVEVICSAASGDFFPVGSTTVSCLAIDDAGNTATVDITIIVNDAEGPDITCPVGLFLPTVCDSAVVPDYRGLALINDNCGIDTITQDPEPGTLLVDLPGHPFSQGALLEVTLEVTDQAGMMADCSFEVEFQDNDAPIITDFVQLALRDCDNNDTIDMRDNLAFGCSGDEVTFTVPYALDCNGDTVWGILPGALPQEVMYMSGSGGNPPTVTLKISPIQLTWCFTDAGPGSPGNPGGNQGNIICYEPLTYIFMDDSKAPAVAVPNDTILYTATDANDECVVPYVANLALQYFDAEACVEPACEAGGPVYPPNDAFCQVADNPGTGLCPEFREDPAGNLFGGYYTDNCGSNVTVEYRRRWAKGCNPMVADLDTAAWGAWVPDNDPGDLGFGLGLHEVQFRVTDQNDNSTLCSFTVRVIDNEQPAWDKETDKSPDGILDMLQDAVATQEQMPGASGGTTGDGSVELEVLLDCNSPSYLADSSALIAWAPTATDECTDEVMVALDQMSTFNLNCVNAFIDGTSYPNNKQRIDKRWIATDECGNSLNNGDGDNNGPDDADDDRYLLKFFTADFSAPVFDPGYDPSGSGVKGTVKVPVAPVKCDTAFSGPGDLIKEYTCNTDGDTLKLFLSDYGLSSTGDTCFLTADQLADTLSVLAIDCTPADMIEYGWEVQATEDCYGNAVPGLPAQSDGLATLAVNPDANNAAEALDEWPVAIYTITYTARDMCGLTSTYEFTLKIVDDLQPVFDDCPDDITANALAGNCFNIVKWNPPSATDNCRGATDIKVEAFDPLGQPVTLWGGSGGSCEDALDFTGDFTSTNWIYTNNGGNGLVDEADAPNSITVTSSTIAAANTEFCINITETGVINFDYLNAGMDDLSDDEFGVSNDNGNTVDWFLNNTTANNDVVGSYSVIVEAGDQFCFVMGSDGDGEGSSIILSNFNFQCADNHVFGAFPVGVSTVRYIAEDFCGMPINRDTCEFTVTIFDNQGPVALCVDTVILDVDQFCERYYSVAFVDAGSWDHCYLDTMWLEQIAGPGFPADPNEGEFFTIDDGPGVYDFELIVQDSAGNTDTCNSTLILRDVAPPTLNCIPYFQRGAANVGCEYQEPGTDLNPTVIDNCTGVVTLVHDYLVAGDPGYTGTNDNTTLQGAVFPLGVTTVTWTATDGSGNAATCETVIEVVDETDPELNCPSPLMVSTSASDNTCGTVVNYNLTADDNCGVVSIVASPASGSILPVGTTIVTAIALDGAGNSDTCSFEVLVEDGTPPTLACSDITVSLDAAGNAFITPQQIANATDNCGEVPTLTISRDSFGCEDIGNNVVVVTATDASNNTSTCEATVTVNDYSDDWAFVFCPADVEEEAPSDVCEINVNLPQPKVQAGCSPDSILPLSAATRDDGLPVTDPYPVGSTGIFWTFVSPITGDVLTCNYNVNVADTTSPIVFNCLDNQPGIDTIFVMMTNQGLCSEEEVFWDEPYALDECTDSSALNSLPLRQRTHAPGQSFGAGCTLVSYEWEDLAGNPAICEFVICVQDTIRPELECPFANVVTADLDECGKATIPLIDFGVGNDNCGIARRCVEIDLTDDGIDNPQIICEPDTMLMVDCSQTPYCDTIGLKYWVEDASGNVSDTCLTALTVIDAIDPVVCAYDTCLFTSVQMKDSCFANHTYEIPFVSCTPGGNAPVCDGSRTQAGAFFYDNDTCNAEITVIAYQVADCEGAFSSPLYLDSLVVAAPSDLQFNYNFPVGRTQLIIKVGDKNTLLTDTAYINVIDTLPPMAVCPADITVGTNDGMLCISQQSLTPPEVTDNCVVDEVLVKVDLDDDGSTEYLQTLLSDGMDACPDLPDWTYDFPKGVHRITYVYADVCENNYAEECPADWESVNTDSCSYLITVNDSIPPVVCEAPGYECQYDEDNFDKPIVYIPTTTDKAPDTCECYGLFDQDIGFKDDCDTLTVTKIVARVDQLPGGITGMEIFEQFYNNQPSFPQNLGFAEVKTFSAKGANADCPFIFENNDTLKKGDWHYFYIAEDCGGFTVDTSFTVRVYDDVEPEILDCPDDITMEALAGECFAEVWWDIPMMFDDNCKVVTDWSCSAEHEGQEIKITSVDLQGCDSKLGFKGQWDNNFWTTAGDSQGYLAQHTADKMVLVDPNFNALYTSRCVTVPNDGLLSFHLSLTGPTFSNFGVNGGFINDGNFENLFIGGVFGPSNGNEQDFYFTVPVEAGTEFCFFVQNGSTLEVTDFQFTCGGAQHKGLFPVGESKITYVISDGMTYEYCGDIVGPNYDTCTINVTVEDTQDPIAMCQDITVQVINGVAATITPEDLDGGSADNCGKIASKEIIGQSSFDCDDIGKTIQVQLAVFDQAGNSDTCIANVSVQEVANPTVGGCPADINLEVAGNCLAVLKYDIPYILTGCDSLDMMRVAGPASGEVVGPGVYNIVYEAPGSGGTLSCAFTATVVDNTAPTFAVEVEGQLVADGDSVHLQALNGYCFANAEWEVLNVSDNCDSDPQVTSSHSSGSPFLVGCSKVTVTVTDDFGNASTLTFFICVKDDEAPLLTCMDVTVFLNEDGLGLLDSLAPVNFVQDDCGITRITLSQDTFTCDDLGLNPEVITAFDAGGNSTSCGFHVTVIDQIAPEAVCQDITVDLDENGMATISPADVDGSSTDNTDCFDLSVNVNAFSCMDIGDNTVTLTITDSAGLSDSCTATVTVEDNLPAVIDSCTADLVVNTDPGQCGAVVDYYIPSFLDNCDGLQQGSLVFGKESGAFFETGVTDIRYIYIDTEGNVSSACDFTITVLDNEDPIIDCNPSADLVQPNDSGLCSFTMPGMGFDVSATDNCGVISLTHDYAPAPQDTTLAGATFPVGITSVTWVAVDAAGNSDICMFEIEVQDAEAPVLAPGSFCAPDTIIAATLNECDQIYTWEPPFEALDNCDGIFNRFSGKIEERLIDPAGNTNTILPQYDYEGVLPAGLQQAQFPVGISTVLYIATDDTGNSDTICKFRVIIQDLQPPTIICPADQVLSATCDSFPIPDYTGMPGLTDNCVNNIITTQTPVPATFLQDADLVDANNNGETDEGDFFEVLLIAKDDFGNADSCTFKVILDNVGEPVPALNPLPPVTSECGDLCLDAPIALGECGDTIYGLPSIAQGICGDNQYLFTSDPGLYFITWTYEDENGNTRTQIQQITVTEDLVAPEVECQNVEVYLDANGEIQITPDVVVQAASDNCVDSVNLEYDLSEDTFGCDDLSATVSVTVTVTDQAGNSSTCSASVTVVDTLAPIADCQDDLEIFLNADGEALLTAGEVDDQSMDNCSIEMLKIDKETFDCGDIGVQIVTLTVWDASGNSDQCTAEVTVTDGTPPTAECQDAEVFINEEGEAVLTVSAVNNGSSDNCTVSSLELSQEVFDCEELGENTVTLTVTDQSGLSTTCTSTVTVSDTTAPVIECSPDIEDCCAAQTVSVTASDNCGELTIIYAATLADGETLSGEASELTTDFPPGLSVVIFTAEDPSGNKNSCVVEVNITDDKAPVAACRPDVNLSIGEDGTVTLPATFFDGGSFDVGCGSSQEIAEILVSVEGSDPAEAYTFTCDQLGQVEYVLYLSDCAGNTSTCWGYINLEDKTAPFCVAIDTLVDVTSSCDATLTAEDLGYATLDNCTGFNGLTLLVNGQPEITVDQDDVPEVVYTLTAIDSFGNTSTCEGTITVTTQGVQCSADTIVLSLDENGMVALTQTELEAAIGLPLGSCAADTAFFAQTQFDCDDVGVHLVPITIISAGGAMSTCPAIVKVVDDLAPECGDFPIQTLELDVNGQVDMFSIDLTPIQDNCTDFGDLTFDFSIPPTFDCADIGMQTFDITATDLYGNSVTCELTVEIVDNLSAAFNCDQTHDVILNGAGLGFLTVPDIVETPPIDNCGIDTAYLSQSTFDCSDLGVQDITVFVEDVNGNVNTCVVEVTVIANDPILEIVPTVVKSDETLAGAKDGSAEVTAVVDGNGIDISDEVTYGWTGPNGFVGNNAGIDSLAPGDYCVLITNTNTGCATVICVTILPGVPPSMITLAGSISTDYGMDVGCVEVDLTGDDEQSMETDVIGEYLFEVPAGGTCTVKPYNDSNPKEGLSTTDLVYIQLHVLKLLPLDSPYKIIAADADNNGTVSTFDLLYLQSLLLGNIAELPFNTSWRFVDAAFAFPNPSDPWTTAFPESITYTNSEEDQMYGDFVAIKIGDVTETVSSACPDNVAMGGYGIEARREGALRLRTPEQQVTRGETYRVAISAADFEAILGGQFSLHFDAGALRYRSVEAGALTDFSEANLGLTHLAEGRILGSWVNAQGVSAAEDELLFTLNFEALTDAARLSDLLKLDSDGPLANEAYTREGALGLELDFTGVEGPEFALMQNTPNPFRDQTIIGFVLPKPGPATLTLRDAAGRLLRSYEGNFQQGYNEITINRQELPSAGLVYYQLQSEGHSATKKMIIIE